MIYILTTPSRLHYSSQREVLICEAHAKPNQLLCLQNLTLANSSFQNLFCHQIYLACCAFGDQLFKFQWLGTLRAVNCFVGVLHAIYPLLVDTRSTISCCQKYLSTLKTILMEQYHFFALQIRIEFIHKSVKWTLFTCCSWIICHMVFTPNSMDSKFQLSLQWIGVLTDGFLQVL